MEHLCEPCIVDTKHELWNKLLLLTYLDTTFCETKYKIWFNTRVSPSAEIRVCCDRLGNTHALVAFSTSFRTSDKYKFFFVTCPEIRKLKGKSWAEEYKKRMDIEDKKRMDIEDKFISTQVQGKQPATLGSFTLCPWQKELAEELLMDIVIPIRWFCLEECNLEGAHIAHLLCETYPKRYISISVQRDLMGWKEVIDKSKEWSRFCLFVICTYPSEKSYAELETLKIYLPKTRVAVIANCTPRESLLRSTCLSRVVRDGVSYCLITPYGKLL